MSIYFNQPWWRNCYQITKCLILRWEIWLLLYGELDWITTDKIDRLIHREKYRHPGQSEDWYLEKIISDLRSKTSV